MLCLTFLSAAYFFSFKMKQAEVRREVKTKIKRSIPKSELIKFELLNTSLFENTNQLKWENDGKEVVIDGDLFDIVYMTKNTNSVTLWLLPDTKEKAILADLDHFVRIMMNNSPVQKDQNNTISDWLKLKYEAMETLCLTVYPTESAFEFRDNYVAYSFVLINELFQPPQLILDQI